MIVQINYDLKKPGQNYEDLIKKIKSLGDWAKPCESCWLVDVRLTTDQVYNTLLPLIDVSDRILVSKFDSSSCRGWLSEEVANWISKKKNPTTSLYATR